MKLRRLVILIIAGAFAVAAPAHAQTAPQTVGIRILDVPANRASDPRAREYIVDHIAPGTTISRRVEVSNDTSQTQVVQLYAAAGSISNGSFQFGAGRAVNELTTWTTVTPASVSPASGAKAVATVTIAVPANASPGERYAVVWAELAAAVPAGGGIAAVNRVGVRIYLSVGPGGEPASDFAITAFEAERDAAGNPVVAATVHNTGGRAVDLSGDLTLSNGPGGLSAGPFAAQLGTTLGIGQTEPVRVILDRAIPAGPWDAHIVLHSGLLQREASATITFPVAAASAAAPVLAAGTGGGTSGFLILAAVGALIALFVIAVLLMWRRRRRESDPTSP